MMKATKAPALLPRGIAAQKIAVSTATTVAVTQRNTIHWLSHHLSSLSTVSCFIRIASSSYFPRSLSKIPWEAASGLAACAALRSSQTFST